MPFHIGVCEAFILASWFRKSNGQVRYRLGFAIHRWTDVVPDSTGYFHFHGKNLWALRFDSDAQTNRYHQKVSYSQLLMVNKLVLNSTQVAFVESQCSIWCCKWIMVILLLNIIIMPELVWNFQCLKWCLWMCINMCPERVKNCRPRIN